MELRVRQLPRTLDTESSLLFLQPVLKWKSVTLDIFISLLIGVAAPFNCSSKLLPKYPGEMRNLLVMILTYRVQAQQVTELRMF